LIGGGLLVPAACRMYPALSPLEVLAMPVTLLLTLIQWGQDLDRTIEQASEKPGTVTRRMEPRFDGTGIERLKKFLS
jgi:hypothetical protein